MNQKIILYTVSGLTILTVITVLAANIFPNLSNDIIRMWGLGAVLAEIIALFVFMVKTTLKQKNVNIFLTIPEELQMYSNNILWDNSNCFAISGEIKENIQLLKVDTGGLGYRVHFNKELTKKIHDMEIIEFDLKEQNGNKWRVGPFYMYDRTRNLEYLETEKLNLNYD